MGRNSGVFKFKQFSVDQTGCAMKVNTDGVLLGAIADAESPAAILDIGTGTGVVALMLAQRFTNAKVDAVEIDAVVATTAERNFKDSPFADRLTIHASGFEKFFDEYPHNKSDLIVSNPPFYIDSLKSPGVKKAMAKHTDFDFFERLIDGIAGHLSPNGSCWLILPVNIAKAVTELAAERRIFLQMQADILSFAHSAAHRAVLCFGFEKTSPQISKLIIYNAPGIYSGEYKRLLQSYFIVF